MSIAAATGVGKHISRWNIHQQERVQHNLEAARLEIANGGNDRIVRRRAAIGGCIIIAADLMRVGAGNAADAPALPAGCRMLDARHNAAFTCAQVGCKPWNDQRHRFQIGAQRLQLIEGSMPIAFTGKAIAVYKAGFSRFSNPPDLIGMIAEFGRARDDANRSQAAIKPRDRTQHLECELRDPIAEILQRKSFKDHIGRAPEGRGIGFALLACDQRINLLILIPLVEANFEPCLVDLDTIGPDARYCGDRPLTKTDSEIREIGIFPYRGS